jgi:hypothetical protein
VSQRFTESSMAVIAGGAGPSNGDVYRLGVKCFVFSNAKNITPPGERCESAKRIYIQSDAP